MDASTALYTLATHVVGPAIVAAVALYRWSVA